MSLTKKLERLPTWTTLSVRKEFEKRTQNIKVFFEELPERNTTEDLYVELRIDGPFIKTVGAKDEIEAQIEVNALITAAYSEKDTQRLNKLAGIVIQALVEDFCIYKLGIEPCDDKTYFDVFKLVNEDRVEFSNFGQIDSTNRIYQGTVEAHYQMRFKNGPV